MLTYSVLQGVVLLSFFTLGSCRRAALHDALTIATDSAVTTLDPRFDVDTHSENAVELIFNGLFKVNRQLEVIPDLLESQVTPDARHYLFKIRSGVKFHDGTELSAEDVAYTFRYMADEKNASPFNNVFGLIERIDVKGQVVSVTLKEPYAFFDVAARRPIVPQSAAEKYGKEFSKRPIGTGPYMLESWSDAEGLRLKANPGHFAGAPRIPRIHIRPVLDSNARVLELLKGSVDVVQSTSESFSVGMLDRLKADPAIQILHGPATHVNYLNFNLRHPILRNREVRRAIAHAIDREAIIRYKLGGFAKPADTLLPPSHWARESDVEKYSYDPSKAKQILDHEKYRDSDGPGPQKRFSLVFKTSTNPLAIERAQAIAAQLEAVGIGVEIRSSEFGTFFDDIKKGNFDLYALQWTSILIPDHYYEVFHSKSVPPKGLNRNFYSNSRLDLLLEEGRKTTDRKRQIEIYSEAQKIVAHDIPCVPLWYPEFIAAVRTRLKGYEIHPRGTYDSLLSAVISPRS